MSLPQGFALFLDGGSDSLGNSTYLLLGLGVLFSVITIHFIWRAVRRDNSEAPEQHHESGMIVCPECGKPTETEYRFCRHCAGDTGKGYVDMVGSDDSSQSGMF